VKLRQVVVVALLALAGCAVQDSSSYKQKSETERIQAWNNVAREYIRLEQYENAKRPLKQALEIEPGSAESLMLMAFTFQRQGEVKIADDYYQQALASAPDSAMINNNYGIFLLVEKRYQQACQYLKQASEDPLYEQRAQALENLASCYSLSGRADLAEETYLQVLRLNPNAPNAIVEMGAIEYAREDYGKAYQYYQRFSSLIQLRQAEHTAKSLYLGVLLSRQNNDPGRAATYALLLKNMYPDSVEYQRYKESR
jgi:type IV pilus assembly protein PilF